MERKIDRLINSGIERNGGEKERKRDRERE